MVKEKTKKWYLSKTMWINFFTIVGALFTGIASYLTTGQAVAILAVVNMVLRLVSKDKVELK